jgi:hypothetical protein
VDQLSPENFHVDFTEREVTHKPSGVVISFYEYVTEDDWRKSDSVTLRDNTSYRGDRRELARAAKEAALAKGMTREKFHRRTLIDLRGLKHPDGNITGPYGQCWADPLSDWQVVQGAEFDVEIEKENRLVHVRVLTVQQDPPKVPGAHVVPHIIAEPAV